MEQRPIEDLNFLQVSHNSSNHRQLYQCSNSKLSTIANWIEQNVQKTCNVSNNSAINANKSHTTTSKRAVSTSSSGKRGEEELETCKLR
uniref:Uncharacterized protein n=1 Tax=Romanomermis culicivorax TaxID=13658 RepID=A0A915IBV9_ROMCU